MKNYELLKEAAKATGKSKFTSRELKEFAAKYDMPANEFYKALRKFNKTPRSARTYWYSCEAAPPVAPAAESTMALATNVTSIKSNDVYVPTVVSEYVKWGQSKNIEKIIKSTELPLLRRIQTFYFLEIMRTDGTKS